MICAWKVKYLVKIEEFCKSCTSIILDFLNLTSVIQFFFTHHIRVIPMARTSIWYYSILIISIIINNRFEGRPRILYIVIIAPQITMIDNCCVVWLKLQNTLSNILDSQVLFFQEKITVVRYGIHQIFFCIVMTRYQLFRSLIQDRTYELFQLFTCDRTNSVLIWDRTTILPANNESSIWQNP